MSNVRFSVIMPVYNAENFLSETIRNFFFNSSSDFELICINDSSTDNSLEILESYYNQFSNFKVINLDKNTGVSNARNLGLDYASGEYILFLDSDDFFEVSFFKFLNDLDFDDVDLLIFKHMNTSSRNGHDRAEFSGRSKMITSEACIDVLVGLHSSGDSNLRLSSVWGKIFRKDLILKHHLYLKKNLNIGEDSIFLLKYYSHANNIKIYDKLSYYYYFNPNSLTHTFQKEMIENDKKWQEAFQEFLKVIPESHVSGEKLVQYRDYSLAKGLLNICYLYLGHKESNFGLNEIIDKMRYILSLPPYSTYDFKNTNLFFKKDRFILILMKYRLYYILGFIFVINNKFR